MAQNISPDALFGTTVYDKDGDKIGKVDEVYLDNESGEPEWISVKTGLFGGNVSLLPLAQASRSGDGIVVPFDKDLVKDAPHHDPGVQLSGSDEADKNTPTKPDAITSSGSAVCQRRSPVRSEWAPQNIISAAAKP